MVNDSEIQPTRKLQLRNETVAKENQTRSLVSELTDQGVCSLYFYGQTKTLISIGCQKLITHNCIG